MKLWQRNRVRNYFTRSIRSALGTARVALVGGLAVILVVGACQFAQATPQDTAAKPVQSKDESKDNKQDDKLTEAQRTSVLFKKSSSAGVKFLLEKGQADDGSFSKQLSPAVTALCTSALLELSLIHI